MIEDIIILVVALFATGVVCFMANSAEPPNPWRSHIPKPPLLPNAERCPFFMSMAPFGYNERCMYRVEHTGTHSYAKEEPSPFRHGATDEFEEAERDVVVQESYEQT